MEVPRNLRVTSLGSRNPNDVIGLYRRHLHFRRKNLHLQIGRSRPLYKTALAMAAVAEVALVSA